MYHSKPRLPALQRDGLGAYSRSRAAEASGKRRTLTGGVTARPLLRYPQ